jgi:FAD:protein FMN transferase
MLKKGLLSLLLLLSSCESPPFKPPVLFTQNVMTIDYRILIGDSVTIDQKKEIDRIIQFTFHEIDTLYNKWNPHSELSALNRLKAEETHPLSPELYLFFQRIDTLVKATGGKFDPTIEPLQNLWKKRLEKGTIPTEEELQDLKPCIGWHRIHFENGIFYKENDGIQLDFGGAAKGFCVDLLTERLNQAGFANLFIEWGGEIRTSGEHPDKRPWTIFISKFENSDPAHALAKISLRNEAIATSGNYLQTWFLPNGKIYSHIFNPVTLHPIEVSPSAIASASVVAKDCMTADVFGTALLLFESIEEAREWSDGYPEYQFFLWSRDLSD